jgi:thiol-disulfide isomerase/thioredoxin
MGRKLIFLALVAVVLSAAAQAQSLSGTWQAAITINGTEFPFRLELAADSAKGTSAQGWFFNGDVRVPSTSGSFRNGTLILNFDHMATKLQATLKDGVLEGQYGPYSKELRPVKARRLIATASSKAEGVPQITGLWELEGVDSKKGELAWRLIVNQTGAEVSAAILRVDGDTGTLAGRLQPDGAFVLSHFSGARPALLSLRLNADGTLSARLTGPRGVSELTATRPAVARSKGLPEPTDPAHHTTVKDPSEPFRFSFTDLKGQTVSNTDARFKGKVVLVNIMGSWCPNCHDEAPYLEALYRKYRAAGLEIVALSFEDDEQLQDPTRLRAFIKQYGLDYTVLLAGQTSELSAKLPQAVNLDAWPTTFFLGRDGRIRAIHAGFPGPATGELHREARREFEAQVELLLGAGVEGAGSVQ